MNANPPWHLEPRVRRTAHHCGFEYRPDIDGLRAIAIIAVVVFHALPTLMPGGFIGVDIFFVISGYLIAGIVFEEIDSGTFRIARFYQRRVLRLFPALTLVFATSLLAGSFILLDTEYFQLAEHMLAGAFGFANITLWYETGYFELQSKATPLLHLWSLGVEEQFYLVLPFTLIVLTKRRGALLRILILMCVLSFILCADLFDLFDTSTKFFLPQFRAWELLAGVILAYGQRSSSIENKSSAPEKFRDTIATLGVAALLCSLIVLNSANFSAFGALLPVSGALLLIAAGPRAWVNRNLLANKYAVLIGLISYPLYMWHWPIIGFFNIIQPEFGIPWRITLIMVSTLLAFLTWKYIERPVRDGSWSASTLAYLTGAMVCISLCAAVILLQAGQVGWAGQGGAIGASFDWRFAVMKDKKCTNWYWGHQYNGIATLCSRSNPAIEPSVALIGDSHAGHLFSGIEQYYRQRNENVVSFSAPSCILFSEFDKKSSCTAKYDMIWNKLSKIPSITTVILGGYVAYMQGEHHDYVRNVHYVLKELGSAGKKVVFMLDVPQLDIDPRDCVRRPFQPWRSESQDRCSLDRSVYDSNTHDYHANVSEAVADLTNVTVFDLADKLCDKNICHIKLGEIFLYRDSNHLNDRGSLLVSHFYNF